MKKVLVLLFIVSLLVCISHALDYPKPNDDYLNDYAGIFSAEDSNYLKLILNDVRQNSTAEVVVVTIEELNGNDISQYAVELGQDWGVGKKDKDNGLVILYSKKENKIFAATGYGLEGILPDSKVGRLLDEYYVPYRDSGNPQEGIIKFTEQVGIVIEDNAEEIRSGQTSSNNMPYVILTIIIIVIMILVIVLSIFRMNAILGILIQLIGLIGCFILSIIGLTTIAFIVLIICIVIGALLGGPGLGRGAGGWRIGGGSIGSGMGGGGFGGGGFGGGGAGR